MSYVQENGGGGTGSGTVTSIAQGAGILATPNPITATGTIALANTAVTPGSYLSTNLTVDAQGRITAAANGTGGPAVLAINSSAVTGGAGTGQVLYENGLLQEAASFTIISGQPNVVSGKSYLYNGVDVMHAVAGANFFDGGSGNFTVSGANNCGTGSGALAGLSTGHDNQASGTNAGTNCTTGATNVFFGSNAGSNCVAGIGNVYINTAGTPGNNNVAVAGLTGTGGNNNTVIGAGAMIVVQPGGDGNVALGFQALENLTVGTNNLAIGNTALQGITTGSANIAIGSEAGLSVTSGVRNTCIGQKAGLGITTGSDNIVFGLQAMNVDGLNNVILGPSAVSASAGPCNSCTILGSAAGVNNAADENVFIGAESGNSVTTGAFNCFVGRRAGQLVTTGGSNTFIGQYNGTPTMSNNVVLADGSSNVAFQYDPTNGIFIKNNAAFLLRALTTLTAGSTANAPTLTAGPVTGNPTKWIAIDDNGVTRFIPAW